MLVPLEVCAEFKYSLKVNIPPACLTFDLCELDLFVFLSCNNKPRILTVSVCVKGCVLCVCTCVYPHADKETDGNL